MTHNKPRFIEILPRFLIGLVTFFNLDAAFAFLFYPQNFSGGFELSGDAGNAVIQGMGLLFLMWNIPYLVALINPFRYKVSLIEAVIMQAIGVIGETILLLILKGEHPLIKASVLRFILFDGGGLIFLGAALFLVLRKQKLDSSPVI